MLALSNRLPVAAPQQRKHKENVVPQKACHRSGVPNCMVSVHKENQADNDDRDNYKIYIWLCVNIYMHISVVTTLSSCAYANVPGFAHNQ